MNTYVNYRYCYVPWERLHIGALIERHLSRGRLVEGLDDSFLRFEDAPSTRSELSLLARSGSPARAGRLPDNFCLLEADPRSAAAYCQSPL